MRRPNLLVLSAAATVACSSSEPTAIRPEFAADCGPSTLTGPATATVGPPPVNFSATQSIRATAAATPTGIPYGVNGLTPDTMHGASVRWTEATLLVRNMNDALHQLAAAKARNIRMWLIMTVGDEQNFFVSSRDHRFCVAKWDSIFDAHVAPNGPNLDGTSPFYPQFQPYIDTDSTLLGHVLLDDIANLNSLTQAQLDTIAAHSNRRFPGLLTAVRAAPTQLRAAAPPCDSCTGGKQPYGVLDVGWAQYSVKNGDPATFRDAEITAAKNLELGLVLGINIRRPYTSPDISQAPIDSVSKWGKILLAADSSDYACAFNFWNDTYSSLRGEQCSTRWRSCQESVASPCKRR